MRTSRARPHAAFTLVEMLLGSVAAMMLVATLFTAMLGWLDGFAVINAQAALQTQLSYSLDQIVKDTQAARQAPGSRVFGVIYTRVPISNAAPATGTPLNGAGASWIVEVPSIDAFGQILNASSLFDYIIYVYTPTTNYTSPGQLSRIVDANPSSSRQDVAAPGKVVANNVSTVIFRAPTGLTTGDGDDKAVDIEMRLIRTERRRPYEMTLTKRAVYRNQ